jgi:hypothetical protein
MTISRDKANDPGDFSESEPWNFLYQTGYLTLRPGQRVGSFYLDYPNLEVSEAISKILITNYFNADTLAVQLIDDLINALDTRNVDKFIEAINFIYAHVPYDDYESDRQRDERFKRSRDFDFLEFYYRSLLVTCFLGAKVKVSAETHGHVGRSDLVIERKGQIWVIEIQVVRKNESDEKKANDALAQINLKNYHAKYKNPILLGIAVNEQKRSILAWKSFFGLKDPHNPKKNGDDDNRPRFKPYRD